MDKLDVLNREEFVEQLITLTENVSVDKTSVSFAINGKWGVGKSFVLDMYEEKLASDKYFIVRYNCWKYDYYEEPLIAIVEALIDAVNKNTQIWTDESQKASAIGFLKVIGGAFLSVVNKGIKDKTGIDIQKGYRAVKENVQAEKDRIVASHDYDGYFSFNQTLQQLKEMISEIARNKTIVMIVDELDRCLPEYAIKVLERLHHFSDDNTNIITVLSVDKIQLQKSVQQIFGFDHPEKYLEKFIHFEIGLSSGSVSQKIVEKYASYIALFDQDLFCFDDSVQEFLQAIMLGIDVRAQENLFRKAHIAHRILFTEPKDYSFMCMEILLTTFLCYHNTGYSFNIETFKFDSNAYQGSPSDIFKGKWRKFFEEKFSRLPLMHQYGDGQEDPDLYILSEEKTSLYGAILFLWCWLHKKHRTIIQVQTKGCYEPIRNNEKELQKFIETILMIQ